MQDSEMRDKLEKIIKAYEELQAKMSDPAVLADQKEYNKLAKEYSDQGELVAKSREYLQACADIDEAKEMLGDPDMKEFAQETISAAEAKLPSLEEDIKFLLIPSDPADEKDIIVEIRAAAGGDEAAIFAGDLFKMYERFCSSRKWKIELMDVSPSDAGGYIAASETGETSIPGVFAAGDVRAKALRQVVTAVSDGAVCAEQAANHVAIW